MVHLQVQSATIQISILAILHPYTGYITYFVNTRYGVHNISLQTPVDLWGDEQVSIPQLWLRTCLALLQLY